jgi:histone H3/H4
MLAAAYIHYMWQWIAAPQPIRREQKGKQSRPPCVEKWYTMDVLFPDTYHGIHHSLEGPLARTTRQGTQQSASLTMRVDRATRQSVEDIARRVGSSMQEVVAQAVEAYRRQIIVDEANIAYGRLRADPQASEAFDREHEIWEQALSDGLRDDSYLI